MSGNGKTAVIGMGRTGCAAVAYLQRLGMPCEAFDERQVTLPEELRVPLNIGPLQADVLNTFDRIVVSPGINWQHPALVAAREAGVAVVGDLQLFGESYKGAVIAITGTNGKTTTVSLIATMLDTLPGGIEAGGNIGTPMLELIGDGDDPMRVVLELSSFQLERADPVKPRWAALLNVQPDHADMHESPDAYRDAKLRLFAAQGDGDKAMLPAGSDWDGLAAKLKARGVYVRRFGEGDPEELDCGIERLADGGWQLFWHHYSVGEFIRCDDLPVQGVHQHLNLAVAAQAATDFGVSPAVVRQALTSFRGLPHRMQALGSVAGREWFNDSKATNPDSAAAALCSFSKVNWICGGLRKGLSLDDLAEPAAARVNRMFVIGKDSEPFLALARSAGVPVDVAGTIDEAVKMAARTAPGIPVLLSPAAASQDQFTDYAERGRAFASAIKALEERA